MKTYQEFVLPHQSKFVEIVIPQNKLLMIEEFSKAVVACKQNESHHIVDDKKTFKRFYTGTFGEAAIEELLQLDLIDWNIGHSNAFNEADLRTIGLNVGIKTVEFGKFPIVHLYPKRPEIIVIKKDWQTAYVCGLATRKSLKTYQDIELILSADLRKRGTKTGFYGFHDLIRFTNIGVLSICSSLQNKK